MDKVAILKAFFPNGIPPESYAQAVEFVESNTARKSEASVASPPHRVRRQTQRAGGKAIASVATWLASGSATVNELAKASGYSYATVYYTLNQMGAVKVGSRPRKDGGIGRGTDVWALPAKEVKP